MLVDAQLISMPNGQHRVQHGTDAGLYVQFFLEAVQDEEESSKQGRPIFRDVEYIKIIPVGDKNTVVCEPVTDEHRYRWPQKYAAFQNQQAQPLEGTPLEEWPPLTKSQVMMFKAANVHTVEQLVNVSDTNLFNLGMGARDIREKAKLFLKSAEGNAGSYALQEQLNNALLQIEALKNQMAGFNIEGSTEKRKQGRPKKEVDNGENIS